MEATVANGKSHERAGDGFDNSFWLGCAVGVHERCSKRSMVFAGSSSVKQSKSTGPGEANVRGPVQELYPGIFSTHEQTRAMCQTRDAWQPSPSRLYIPYPVLLFRRAHKQRRAGDSFNEEGLEN